MQDLDTKPEIVPVPPAMEAWSAHQWTTRKFPENKFSVFKALIFQLRVKKH